MSRSKKYTDWDCVLLKFIRLTLILGVIAMVLFSCDTSDDFTPSSQNTDISSYTLSYANISIATNTAITHSPSNTLPAEATVIYSITPSLPVGLTFDTNTGMIIGTPTSVNSNIYTVTSTGTGLYTGSLSAKFYIRVYDSFDISSYVLSYSNIGVSYDNSGSEVYTINISNSPTFTIVPINPQWNNGNARPVVTYKITPPYPHGSPSIPAPGSSPERDPLLPIIVATPTPSPVTMVVSATGLRP